MVANLKLFYIYTTIDGAIYTISKDKSGIYVATTPKGLAYGTSIDEVKTEIEMAVGIVDYKYVGTNIREL